MFHKDEKIILFPPLLIDDKLVVYIKVKVIILSKFSAEQCTPLKNDVVLPINHMLLTHTRLISLDFTEDKILKLSRALNMNKVHYHVEVCIRMIKIYDK